MYYITMIEGMGRGVIADSDIKAGTVITNCELLVLSEKETPIVNSTDLQWYTFKFNETQDCLVLGDGEIFNHDDNANTAYELIDWNGRKLMQFRAKRDIKRGEQLFIDYNADCQVETKNYNVNLI